jgi:hypothetical protein
MHLWDRGFDSHDTYWCKVSQHPTGMGAIHLMAWPVRPKFFSLYQWKDPVYVSQMSSENGPHSNCIKIFRSDKSEAQTFCVSFNNLTVLTRLVVLIESAQSRGFSPGVPVSSHREYWQGGLGISPLTDPSTVAVLRDQTWVCIRWLVPYSSRIDQKVQQDPLWPRTSYWWQSLPRWRHQNIEGSQSSDIVFVYWKLQE